MRKALIPPVGSEPMVGVLAGQLRDAFQRLVQLVGDMTQDELEYKGPDGRRNSVATLLRHLAYVDMRYLYVTKGQPSLPDHLEAKYGPFQDSDDRLPDVKGKTLEELLTTYRQVHQTVLSEIEQLRDQDLVTVHPGWGGRGEVTVGWQLWQMAAHSLKHQGHIIWLKQWVRQ